MEQQSKKEGLTFLTYITSMTYQAMIFLGQIPHPVTNETKQNLQQAKLLIETVLMLQEKTKGNLAENEQALLNTSVAELKKKYKSVIAEEDK